MGEDRGSPEDRLKQAQVLGTEFFNTALARAEDLLREVGLSGLATQSKMHEALEELIDTSRKGTLLIVDIIRREIQTQLAAMGAATLQDLEDLESRIGGTNVGTAQKAPAVDKAPAAKEAPAVDKAPAAKKAPAVKKAAAVKKAPAVKKAAAVKKAPAVKKAAAVKKAPAAKKAPLVERSSGGHQSDGPGPATATDPATSPGDDIRSNPTG